MNRLRILRPSSFGASDTFSEVTERELRKAGIDCSIAALWPDFWIDHLHYGRIPLGRTIFNRGPARWALGRHLKSIAPGDAVWIDGASLPCDSRCEFERSLLRRGCRYLFNLLDDWFSVPAMSPAVLDRVRMAQLVTVPTNALKSRVLDQAPGTAVEVFGEPVDTGRLYPFETQPGPRLVVWAGNPHNFREIQELDDVLSDCHKEISFLLRVVGGRHRPDLRLGVPWEYRPYSLEQERAGFEGACAGIAPLKASPYATCKGAYKIKTYFAMGIPVVASDVGYQSVLIRHGETGFLARTKDEWKTALMSLLADREQAKKIGAAARKEAVTRYSHAAVIPNWAVKLKSALAGEATPAGRAESPRRHRGLTPQVHVTEVCAIR